MRSWLVLFLLIAFVGAIATPVSADVRESSTISTPAAIVSATGTVFMLANAALWSQDGSVPIGAFGTLLGFAELGVGISVNGDTDSAFKTFSIVVGAMGIITGIGSAARATHRAPESRGSAEPRELPVSAYVRSFDGQHWVGLQLVRNW